MSSSSYLERFMVQVSVGWAYPTDPDELKINVHISYDLLDWTDVIEYRLLADLKKSVNTFTDQFRYTSFPNLGPGECMDIYQMLLETRYIPSNVEQLEKTAKTMALWIEKILSNIGHLDEESRRICKQLFFRSLDRFQKFDILVSKSLVDASQTSGESQEVSNRVPKKRASMLQSMGKMLSMGGKRELRLNEENLEKVTAQRTGSGDGRTDEEPSERPGSQNGDLRAKNTRRSSLSAFFTGKKGDAKSQRAPSDEDSPNDEVNQEKTTTRASLATPIPASAQEIAEKSTLLRIEVQRGQEAQQGVVTYDITLRVVGKKYMKSPMVYVTAQRFSHFKKLYHQLIDINLQTQQQTTPSILRSTDFMLMFTTNFPALPMKSYLGFSLNDSELSERTRALDSWFRDVCCLYRHMPSAARQVVRQFLHFDMSQARDIFFQDQLAWGTIERAENQSRPMLLVQKSVLNTVSEEMKMELGETLSNVDGASGSQRSLSPKRGTMTKRRSLALGRETSSVLDPKEREEGQSQLHNLLWETASMGGTSKISKKKANQSRAILKRIDEEDG